MTNKYVVTRVDADKNLYKIECNGTVPYYVTGCMGVGRDLAGSEIPSELTDLTRLSELERNIVNTVREAVEEFKKKRQRFLMDPNPPAV